MAMRCFGRAFLAGLALAADTRPLDLMVLRAEVLAAVLCPVHFFRTAVLAAALDVAFFCLGIDASPIVCGARLTQNFFVGWAKRKRAHHREPVSDGGHGANAPLPTLSVHVNAA